MSRSVEISVVIPAFNEAGSICVLLEKTSDVLARLGRSQEILVVDDGSTDGTAARVEERIGTIPGLRLIVLRTNCGKSAALATGFRESRGDAYIVTLDGDLQDDPEEIPGMLAVCESGYDLVSGWKRRRRDPLNKRLPSRVFNLVTSWATGIKIHDFNCGFKVYRRPVADSLTLHGELHRYIPVLAHRLGWRVGEKEVLHHPRLHGRSKFGSSRFVNGFLDLLLVMFLSGRHRSPLHVFGRLGVLFLAAGILLNFYMAAIWVIESKLRVRPLLLFAVILVILGIQFISMGLLAEMIAAIERPREAPIYKRLPEEGEP
ncbi:MAG: glycosyltransferase family 2 protein [Candidatus Eisenbacteria bacterium]|nr:glycosyltransferase family 2 protein [Candidatus Eisenbacteria bacterium]